MASAVPSPRLPAERMPGGASRNRLISVEVDEDPSMRLFDLTMQAVSGFSLAAFLEGPAHDYFAEQIYGRFVDEGDTKSGFWEPLHDATVDIRRAMGYSGDHPINERTGELKEWVTEEFEMMGGDDWAQMDLPGSAPTARHAEKLKTAQQGRAVNPLGYGPTGPRPVLAHTEDDLASILMRLQDWIIHRVVGGI